MSVVPVILAGGAGERLWPVSKADYPKQFICVDNSGVSLFQATISRVGDRALFEPAIIVTHNDQRFIVAEQLRLMAVKGSSIILEPAARNTAMSVLLAALRLEDVNPGALILVLPSDHRIENTVAFVQAVSEARAAAQGGYIVAFSIMPGAPETGYGYIQDGDRLAEYAPLRKINAFIEKPTRQCAEALLAQGNYSFNSGMFLMRTDMIIGLYRQLVPEIYAACRTACSEMKQDGDFLHCAGEALTAFDCVSFDVAIMQRTDAGAVLPIDIGWSDVGSWLAVDAMAQKSPQGNAIIGNVHIRDVENCYILSHRPLVAAIGLRDLLVVACDDAVLVADKKRLDEIKPLLAQLRDASQRDINLRCASYRPWGRFYTIDVAEFYQVKRLHINPKAKISLQSHRHRNEHWVVVRGTATVQRDDASITLYENQSLYIAAGERHLLQNDTDSELVIIEVQTGMDLREEDITRHEDIYQRG